MSRVFGTLIFFATNTDSNSRLLILNINLLVLSGVKLNLHAGINQAYVLILTILVFIDKLPHPPLMLAIEWFPQIEIMAPLSVI